MHVSICDFVCAAAGSIANNTKQAVAQLQV
jgi:hypothetical protein